MYEDVIVVYIL